MVKSQMQMSDIETVQFGWLQINIVCYLIVPSGYACRNIFCSLIKISD